MKVVGISNYGDESVSEVLVASDVTQEQGEQTCVRMNATCDRLFYVVKPDDYVLWNGMRDLVGDYDDDDQE